MTVSPPISFIAWSRESSRPAALARAAGGESATFFDLRIHHKPLVPVRYLLSAARMLAYLIRRRPRAVVVQLPPPPAGLLAWAWCRLTGAPLVLDTHPASFETHGVHGAQRPMIAWLARRADGAIVTTPRLGEQISGWGGHPIVLHEAPMTWSATAQPSACSAQRRLLFVCTFAPDEPYAEVVQAARHVPDVTVQITGDLRRLPDHVRRSAPPNVQFLGFLDPEAYVAALAGADVVMSLTTRTDSVQRSAYEAVDALRPLITTDTPHMRELFTDAVFVDNDPDSLAAGIREAFEHCHELAAQAEAARTAQWARWDEQLSELRDVVVTRASSAEQVGTAAGE